MNRSFIEYRNQHMVSPPIDIIATPNNNFDLLDKTTPVFSKWALNLKPSGNLDKGAVAMNVLGAGASAAGALISFGTGIGGATSGIMNAIDKTSNAVNDALKSDMYVQQLSSEFIADYEKDFWDEFNFLQFFEPAGGYIGEIHKGASNEYGYLGHCFYDNGDYFEGFFSNNGVRFGVFIFANGERVLGNICGGQKLECCTTISPDGTRIYGEYQNGEMIKGLYECSDCALAGQWLGGQLHGSGVARYSNGTCFVGEWNHGKPVIK